MFIKVVDLNGYFELSIPRIKMQIFRCSVFEPTMVFGR